MPNSEQNSSAASGLAALLTPKGMALLDSLPEYSEVDSLALGARLRKAGHCPELVAQALTQSRLRAKAREKFGDFADRMLFTQHGLEQATRLSIAAHHAGRFRDAGIERVADLGCGIGADTIAKAGLGMSVIGVDSDPETVAIATVNTSIFEQVRIEHGWAEDFDLSRVEGAWFDPARREDMQGLASRVHDPEQASPPLSFIVDTARKLGRAGSTDGTGTHFGPVAAKLAPAISHDQLIPGTETQWVSWRGQVLEACMYFGPLARRVGEGPLCVPRSATARMKRASSAAEFPQAADTAGLTSSADTAGLTHTSGTARLTDATGTARLTHPTNTAQIQTEGGLPEGTLISRSALVFSAGPDATWHVSQLLPDSLDEQELRTPATGEIEAYMYEPDGAVIRSGLLGTLARQLGAHTIDDTIAYLSSSTHVPSPFARAYRVREVLPFNVKKIAARVKDLGIGTIEIKKRGADIDPAVVRKQLKLRKSDSGSATLIVTRALGEHVAILCDAH